MNRPRYIGGCKNNSLSFIINLDAGHSQLTMLSSPLSIQEERLKELPSFFTVTYICISVAIQLYSLFRLNQNHVQWKQIGSHNKSLRDPTFKRGWRKGFSNLSYSRPNGLICSKLGAYHLDMLLTKMYQKNLDSLNCLSDIDRYVYRWGS